MRYGRVPKRTKSQDEQRVTTTEPTGSQDQSALESRQLAIYDTILTISQAHHANCNLTEDNVKTIQKRPFSLVFIVFAACVCEKVMFSYCLCVCQSVWVLTFECIVLLYPPYCINVITKVKVILRLRSIQNQIASVWISFYHEAGSGPSTECIYVVLIFGSFGSSTKELIQSCFVCRCQCHYRCQCWYQCRCTVLLDTLLDIEISYLV